MAALVETNSPTEELMLTLPLEGDVVTYLKNENVKLTDTQCKTIKNEFEWTLFDLSNIDVNDATEFKELCDSLQISYGVKIKLKSAIIKLRQQYQSSNLKRRSSTISTIDSNISEEYKQNININNDEYTSVMSDDLDIVDKANTKSITISLIGESGVGKTSIIARLAYNKFVHESATIGFDITYKKYRILDQIVNLRIIDTAGQERHHSISNWIYRVSHAFILVFDVTDMDSFGALNNWIERVDESCASQHARRFIVGTKIDKKNRVISNEAANAFAKTHRYTYFEMSAKSGTNVRQVFMMVATYLLKDRVMDKFNTNTNILEDDTDLRSTVAQDGDEHDRRKKRCCR